MEESLESYVGSFIATTKTRKQQMADWLGVSLVTFNRKLSGESPLTIGEARILAKKMNLPLDVICRVAP